MAGTLRDAERLRELSFLERIVRAIASSSDVTAHMQSLVEATKDATSTQVCSLYIWDEVEGCLVLAATDGLPTRAIGGARLTLGQGITGWVAEHKEPAAVLDVQVDPRFVWLPDVDDHRYLSMLSVPVVLGDRLLGVMNVQTDREHVFSEAEIQFLITIAAHCAGIIEITGLHRQLALAEALRVSEERLRQASKMEAVGLLAGGIAHDFNNLLMAMIGFAELVTSELPDDSPHLGSMREITRAGERASELTRQLLAFGRRQVLRPEALDLSDVVADMGTLLGRVIGEDIDLVVLGGRGLRSARVDRGQIEQVILNLAVNARDAMPRGGKLTIETANVELDAEYIRAHGSREIGITQPGWYILLAVSDTGTGMDKATLARIFEPFFTTKDPGKGTGLGLSTVYGIVKQSGGDIWVYSEPNQGTSFKIYLPTEEDPETTPPPSRTEAPGGTETILLVEDEDGVRTLISSVLNGKGYSVLVARSAEEALTLAADPGQSIDLLLTDLVLPGQNGRELAEAILAQRPNLTTLYMSGYTDDVVVRHGVLSAQLVFLQKPFSPSVLLQTVREVLDGQLAEKPTGRRAAALPPAPD